MIGIFKSGLCIKTRRRRHGYVASEGRSAGPCLHSRTSARDRMKVQLDIIGRHEASSVSKYWLTAPDNKADDRR